MPSEFYLDSSVILRAVLGDSQAAREWIDSHNNDRCWLVASRLGELEVRQAAARAKIADEITDQYLDPLALSPLDDSLIDDALTVPNPLKAADAIHLATAARIDKALTIITHDAHMARAAQAMGFKVHDPVTDDPNRPPVAPDPAA